MFHERVDTERTLMIKFSFMLIQQSKNNKETIDNLAYIVMFGGKEFQTKKRKL